LTTGTYTLHVVGSGSAIASNGTGTITGAATATQGSDNTFTVTVAGTVTITVTGTLTFFQLEAGTAFSIIYKRVDNTAVKSLNLGTAGVSGDGVYGGTNGNAGSLMKFVGSRRVYGSVSGVSTTIQSAYAGVTGSSNRLMFSFASGLQEAVSHALMGHGSDSTHASEIWNSWVNTSLPAFRTQSAGGTDTLGAAVGQGSNTWGSVAGTNNGTAKKILVNGVSQGTSTDANLNTTAGNVLFLGGKVVANLGGGSMNDVIYDPNNYADAKILTFSNGLKSFYGL
jgi:hypothetical protein